MDVAYTVKNNGMIKMKAVMEASQAPSCPLFSQDRTTRGLTQARLPCAFDIDKKNSRNPSTFWCCNVF